MVDPHPGDTFLITTLMASYLLRDWPCQANTKLSHAENYALKVIRAADKNCAKVWRIQPGVVNEDSHYGYQLGPKRQETKGTMPVEAVRLIRRRMITALKSGEMGRGSTLQTEMALTRCNEMLDLGVIDQLAEIAEDL